MFLGRKKELQALEKMYKRNSFQMAIVYGRRRIGKTSLLNEFVKDKNSLYFPAEEVNKSLNLQKFTRILGEALELPDLPTITDWEGFFKLIANRFSDEKLVLIIDEYPYLATADKSLNSTLQHIIDYIYKNTNIFLILCGSSMSFMEEHVLGEKSPLFGRRTGQLKLYPLDYYDAAKFYPEVSSEDKVKYYATVGGTPYYLSMIDPDLTFEENIKDLYFGINGYLLNEGTLLMKQEFREPATYNSILQAISSGAVTLGEITTATKLSSSVVSKYLLTLQELNYVEKVLPFDANPYKAKGAQYRIIENFISFWYRYVFLNRTEIEMGQGDFYADDALENLNEFVGPVFEEICLQYMRRANQKEILPFRSKKFGKWWGKDPDGKVDEIDVILEAFDQKQLIIGECKWKNTVKTKSVLEKLEQRKAIFYKYSVTPYLFSKCHLTIPSESDVVLITLEDLFKV